MSAKTKLNLIFGLMLTLTILAVGAHKPLANENVNGLYVKSIEQVLRLEPEEVDLGIASLIIAEEWSEIVPGRRYQQELDDMAYEIRGRIEKQGLQNSYKAIHIINDYLFNELGYTSVKEASDANDLFLHSVMDRKKGYCLSLSILYLAIGERLGLPLYGVVVPSHFFVRYDNGPVRFNIETTSKGGYANDEHYIEKFNVPDNGHDSIYMQNLNKMQSLGCLFNNLGNVYSDEGNIDAAIKALENAVRINPSLAESRTNLGNMYLQKGRINDAVYNYRQALSINPDDAKTYNNLGNAYLEREWFNEAIGAYTKSLELDNDSIEARMNIATAYSKLGLTEKAAVFLREAISMQPNKSTLYSQLGGIYYNAGKYDKAMNAYKKAIQINYKDAEAHYGMGLCYSKLDMVKNEIISYKNALAAKPDMVEALANLGNAYFVQEKYDNAIKQYKKAVALAPDDHTLYYNLGAAYTNEKMFKESVAEYLKAIELNPDMGDTHNGLAYALYKLKNYPEAYKHLLRATQLGVQIDEKLLKAIERKMR